MCHDAKQMFAIFDVNADNIGGKVIYLDAVNEVCYGGFLCNILVYPPFPTLPPQKLPTPLSYQIKVRIVGRHGRNQYVLDAPSSRLRLNL